MCMYIFCKNQCNLNAVIYNKITSFVKVIRLKLLLTLISIVYKYGTLDNISHSKVVLCDIGIAMVYHH